jgi:hypothetical protein
MGRGRSNYTKLYWAMEAYAEEYLELHAPTTSRRGVSKKVQRQLAASRWFKKHFVNLLREGQQELESLNYNLESEFPSNLPLAWFFVADRWPLRNNQLAGPSILKSKKLSSRYFYLYYPEQDQATEVEHRMRANLYLVLIQHFLGREEAKRLLKHYKEHAVKYRKIRGDKGQKLAGEELLEFKMRLGGHSLLIGRLKDEGALETDEE